MPGVEAQQTSPPLQGWSVPVAQPQPMYVQLCPALLRAGIPAAIRAPVAAARRRSVPRRVCRVANERATASNRCPSKAASPVLRRLAVCPAGKRTVSRVRLGCNTPRAPGELGLKDVVLTYSWD